MKSKSLPPLLKSQVNGIITALKYINFQFKNRNKARIFSNNNDNISSYLNKIVLFNFIQT